MRVRSISPVSQSHTFIVLSSLADTKTEYTGWKATALTASRCPVRVCFEEPAVGSQSGLFLLLKPDGRAAIFELSCSASCNRASRSNIFNNNDQGVRANCKGVGNRRTHLLLHPDHARPLLYEEAIALLSKIRLEVGLQSISISNLWRLSVDILISHPLSIAQTT